LLAKKFNTDAGVAAALASARPEKIVHVYFHLLNCIFNEDLLDSGAVEDNSTYWKLCEEQFR
jgi:hypothetical protein